MSTAIASAYTPPPPPAPPEKPLDARRLSLKSNNYPPTATPLLPALAVSDASVDALASGSTRASSTTQIPQIRYCYFIPAASAAPDASRRSSLSQQPAYLSPHVQDSTEVSTIYTQSRRDSSQDTSGAGVFIVGSHPPQIQLQFLEDQPLPTPTPSESLASVEATTPDTVLVERKDSGYGGSVRRTSSFAILGRGIRKALWRSSPRSVEPTVVTEPPTLDCDIPQDVLDHEGWAQDLTHRLSLASFPDAVTTWLGQLPTDLSMPSTVPGMVNDAQEPQTKHEMFGAFNSHPDTALTASQLSKPLAISRMARSKSESTINVPDNLGTSSAVVQGTTRQATGLRKVLSVEHLNKPQPPLPVDGAVNKFIRTKDAAKGTSQFGSLSQRLTIPADIKFGKRSLPSASKERHRPRLHEAFHESASETALSWPARRSYPARLSGECIEELLDGSSFEPEMTQATSPQSSQELSTKGVSKWSSPLFKSLTTSTLAELRTQHQNNNPPPTEILLSSSNLGADEVADEIAMASRSSSLRSSNGRHVVSEQDRTMSELALPLVPPKPLFSNKGVASSVSSLGEVSACGSVDSSVADNSADEWGELSRMALHARDQDARYNADLKDLQTLLYQAEFSNGHRLHPSHSANTSTGSLPSVPPSPSWKDTKTVKSSSKKKDDYMSHRMSSCSPKLLPAVGKTKQRSKSRLSMTYGGGELEVVKHAKFDTPEAIARNREIRKFISQEIYTTELNYLQYLRTIQEVFVEPLFRSLDTDKPFIPRTNPLYQLLGHISALADVSSQVTRRLEDCVRDEVWSDELSLIGTIFLDVKEPLSIFLKYGQAYGKGIKALRTLLKSKRASMSGVPVFSPVMTPANPESDPTVPGAPRLDKRMSLPSIFSQGTISGASLSLTLEHNSVGTGPGSGQAEASARRAGSRPQSSLVVLNPVSEVSEYRRFILNCAGGKETTSRFSLADLLILPIQRVTRYCLLLKDLKRHTSVDHQDYVCIVHALEQLHTLALATNNVQQ
ncbi:hypothetical protein BGZ99_003877 [Dissophora globulifera]|uniref:DH domain-containing protein n=1 Tax=Dissophora globulifera TaxID=979702 RepID=A0A9P6UVT4_9FUNG|nr:hypothetical protein BGZ99_003877 [Dissophora globulifera]